MARPDFVGLTSLKIYSIKFWKLDMARPDFVGWTSLKMNSIKFWKLDRARPDFVGLTIFIKPAREARGPKGTAR